VLTSPAIHTANYYITWQLWVNEDMTARETATTAVSLKLRYSTHARAHARTHARTHTHTHARAHARTHARAHTHTHTHTHTPV